MAYNYEYPYTDAQRYNDDWLINKVKELAMDWLKTSGEWTETQEAWEELKRYITDYFNNLDVQEEINEKLEAMKADGSLFNIIKPLFDEYQQGIDVLSARMDTFTALGDGATTGDAELADIRVDYTGHTWSNAGDAFRGVTGQLSSEIVNESDSLYSGYIKTTKTNYVKASMDGSGVVTNGGYRVVSDFINAIELEHMVICNNANLMVRIVKYDLNDTYISMTNWLSFSLVSPYVLAKGYRYRLLIDGIGVPNNVNSPSVETVINSLIIYYGKYEQYKRIYDTDSLFLPAKVRFSGHRGDMVNAPENTTLAFKKAGERGIWGIETDIWSTTDNVLVCIHDATIDRTTDSTGNVTDYSYEQLKSIPITYGECYGEYTSGDLFIPTFVEFLQICKIYGCVGLIHLQADPRGNVYLDMVYDCVKSMRMLNSVIFQSHDIAQLHYLRTKDSEICITPAFVRTITKSDIDTVAMLGNAGFHISNPSYINSDLITYAKEKDLYIFGGIDPNDTQIETNITAWKYYVGVDNITNTYLDYK